MSDNHPPMFNFAMYKYWAQVRRPFSCPCYSLPYAPAPHGGSHEGLPTYQAGERVEIKDESQEYYDDTQAARPVEYVSVLVEGGWINVWTLYNLAGHPVGVNFCTITHEFRDPVESKDPVALRESKKRRRSPPDPPPGGPGGTGTVI